MSNALHEVKEKLLLLWERLAQARGFNPLYGRILAYLYLSEKPLSQKELSEKTNFSVPAISKAVNYLVTLGAVRRLKEKRKRTYYYSALASPREMFIAGLSKWINDQNIMRRELSTLKTRLESATLTEHEKKEAAKLIAIIDDLEKAFDEVEKAFTQMKERLMRS